MFGRPLMEPVTPGNGAKIAAASVVTVMTIILLNDGSVHLNGPKPELAYKMLDGARAILDQMTRRVVVPTVVPPTDLTGTA
jgi:hypothetical protein